jgi:hypothetical protein
LSVIESIDLVLVDVEPEDTESRVDERTGQGQTDVAQADDTDAGRLVVDGRKKLLLHGERFLERWAAGARVA